jgi:hypothetical protein
MNNLESSLGCGGGPGAAWWESNHLKGCSSAAEQSSLPKPACKEAVRLPPGSAESGAIRRDVNKSDRNGKDTGIRSGFRPGRRRASAERQGRLDKPPVKDYLTACLSMKA